MSRWKDVNFREAGCVVGLAHTPLSWHCPPNATSHGLPDTEGHWNSIWENRHRVIGVAHTHPGRSQRINALRPSTEDLTTFSAVELGLGRRLVWWIANACNCIEVVNLDGEPGTARLADYKVRWVPPTERYALRWLAHLRRISLMGLT